MKTILKAALLASITVSGTAYAVPVSGQGTWETTLLGRDINGNAVAASDDSAVFLYDTVLDVTWLRNANANSRMIWAQANAWANSLNTSDTGGGFTGWRLPTMVDTGTSGCDLAFTGSDCGYNVQTKSGQTIYSEMASLFYDTLGNNASFYPSGTGRVKFWSSWGLTNTGPFEDMQSSGYWSGLEYAPDTRLKWYFNNSDGNQYPNEQGTSLPALAVLDGDVLVSAVPEPETYALMLAGLALVGAAAKRRSKAG